jgi:hypothetical protein
MAPVAPSRQYDALYGEDAPAHKLHGRQLLGAEHASPADRADPTYTVASERDHYRQQAGPGGSGFVIERVPDYGNMFTGGSKAFALRCALTAPRIDAMRGGVAPATQPRAQRQQPRAVLSAMTPPVALLVHLLWPGAG